jgi:hypothetical protein
MHVRLVAVYEATVGDVRADEGRRDGADLRSRWRDRPAAERVAVCWFDADAFFGPDPHPRGSATAYDRIEEVVGVDGAPMLHKAGRQGSVEPAPIPRAEGS